MTHYSYFKTFFTTFFRPNVADELHLAAPEIKCIQDAVRISRSGVGEDVLEGALLPAQTRCTVLPYPDQSRPIEQHEEVSVPDQQRQQEGNEGQSNSRRHHPGQRQHTHTAVLYSILIFSGN